LGFTAIGAMTFYRRWASTRVGGAGSGAGRRRRNRASGAEANPRPSRREVDELLGELLARHEDHEVEES
ncbi:MAG: hypothetical protein L0027_16180, partial [Candidatus Rokubacteria bacterium]|nr:hypothetical protein [Candidatus Rokubacteria bacterium]